MPPFLGVDLSSQKNQTNLAEGWQLFVLFNESAGQQWENLADVSWLVIAGVGVLGLILTTLSFKGFNSELYDKKDSLGVNWSERITILSLNGIFLLLGAIGAAIFKYSSLK
ncbi:MAG: hypothetical protein IPJ84_16545 [Bdellovibrionales bacterium]|nr:hypothetical protein [Bdellovibrionales bacterium]